MNKIDYFKKNCPEKYFENKISETQDYEEYHHSLNYFKKANFNYNNNFQTESIDDYFTSIQIISNALLLKKYNLFSKKSNCSYFLLYNKKEINKEEYLLIEKIRETRNSIHYHGYIALYLDNDIKEKIIKDSIKIFNKLKETYEN